MNIPVQPSGKKSLSLSVLLNISSALDKSDAANYEAIVELYNSEIKPRDIFEEQFAIDLAESVRIKHKLLCSKEHLTKTALYDALAEILRPLVDNPQEPSFPSSSESLARDFYLGDAKAIQRINDLLTKAGMTMNNVEALAYAKNLRAMEHFDLAIASAESRWIASKREFDRHRVARRLQELPPAEDADFEVVNRNNSRDTAYD
jgi:hypothetical protein